MPPVSMTRRATSVSLMCCVCETRRIRVEGVVRMAAERVHEYSHGLVHHGAGLNGLLELRGSPLHIAEPGGVGYARRAERGKQRGER